MAPAIACAHRLQTAPRHAILRRPSCCHLIWIRSLLWRTVMCARYRCSHLIRLSKRVRGKSSLISSDHGGSSNPLPRRRFSVIMHLQFETNPRSIGRQLDEQRGRKRHTLRVDAARLTHLASGCSRITQAARQETDEQAMSKD